MITPTFQVALKVVNFFSVEEENTIVRKNVSNSLF